MTSVREHVRSAHMVRGHFRARKWINAYMMPECTISAHLRRI
ncbi:hypothetical protein [Bacillus rubiinfantis]|nr:hypothetical protein [Bacillus rubiinfantis]